MFRLNIVSNCLSMQINLPLSVPMRLLEPSVDVLDSTSLSISWSEPLEPNGIIINYTIFL